MYCNGPPLEVEQGSKVRFHFIAIGSEVDLHGATLSDATFTSTKQRVPAISMLAGSMSTADVVILKDPGSAVLQCRTADHIEAGMQALVNVLPANSTNSSSASSTTFSVAAAAGGGSNTMVLPANATVRQYFVQAEEEEWEYVPQGRNWCGIEGPEDFDEGADVFVERYPGITIGSTYRKALYRRYNNDNFNVRIPVPAQHGILGPILAAEVGDVLNITFKNALKFDVNLHVDAGLVPLKGSSRPEDPVSPGETARYILAVPESTGPGALDLNTVTYGYTSSVDLVYHPYGGLVGIALIGSRGAFDGLDPEDMPANPVPAGVDGLLPLFLAVMNEGETPFVEENIEMAGVEQVAEGESHRRLSSLWDNTMRNLMSEAGAEGASGSIDFGESNLMHSINGYMYCNMPIVHIEKDKTMRVAVLSFGSETDLHGLAFSGQSLIGSPKGSPRESMEVLLPAVAMSADMTAMQPGMWTFSCLVHDHEEVRASEERTQIFFS